MNRRIPTYPTSALLLPAMLAILLTGCASVGPKPYVDIPADAPAEIAALEAGVAENPLALLELARAWDRAAGGPSGGDEYRQLAATGYRSALNLAPNDYLTNMLAGRNEFAAGCYSAAQSLFATAVLAAPDDATAVPPSRSRSRSRSRCARMRAITRSRPWQQPQMSISVANARFRRCAQLIATCFGTAGASASCFAPFPPAPRPAGVIAARNLLDLRPSGTEQKSDPVWTFHSWFIKLNTRA